MFLHIIMKYLIPLVKAIEIHTQISSVEVKTKRSEECLEWKQIFIYQNAESLNIFQKKSSEKLFLNFIMKLDTLTCFLDLNKELFYWQILKAIRNFWCLWLFELKKRS